MARFEMKRPWSHVPGWVEKSRLVHCLPLGKGRLAGQGVGEAAPSGQKKRNMPSMNLQALRLYHIRGNTVISDARCGFIAQPVLELSP